MFLILIVSARLRSISILPPQLSDIKAWVASTFQLSVLHGYKQFIVCNNFKYLFQNPNWNVLQIWKTFAALDEFDEFECLRSFKCL